MRAVGGLKDTVEAVDDDGRNAETATGFMFREPAEGALLAEIHRLVAVYRDQPELWLTLQRNAMAQRFEWDHAAQEYLALFRSLISD